MRFTTIVRKKMARSSWGSSFQPRAHQNKRSCFQHSFHHRHSSFIILPLTSGTEHTLLSTCSRFASKHEYDSADSVGQLSGRFTPCASRQCSTTTVAIGGNNQRGKSAFSSGNDTISFFWSSAAFVSLYQTKDAEKKDLARRQVGVELYASESLRCASTSRIGRSKVGRMRSD